MKTIKKKNIVTILVLLFVYIGCGVQSLICMNQSSHAPVFESIFGTTPHRCHLNHPKMVDGYCKKFVGIAVDLFKAGDLFMLDGVPGNDQCHLESLYLVELYRQYKAGAFCVDQARDAFLSGKKESFDFEKIRFLALSFFLSSALGPIENFKRRGIDDFFEKKTQGKISSLFGDFHCRNAAQNGLGNILFSYAKQSLNEIVSLIEKNPEYLKELPEHSKNIIEDIRKLLTKDVSSFYLNNEDCELGRPRLPKFVGAFIFLVKARLLKIPFVFKMKSICRNGVHYTEFKTTDDTSASAIIIEGITLCDGLSYNDFKTGMKKCYHSLFNKKDGVHRKDESCFLCQKCSEDDHCQTLAHQRKALSEVFLRGIFCLVLPIAADFTHVHQNRYEQDFFSEDNVLSALFALNIKAGQEQGLCEKNPSTFVISHVHAAIVSTACNIKTLFVDMRYEDCIKPHKNSEGK